MIVNDWLKSRYQGFAKEHIYSSGAPQDHGLDVLFSAGFGDSMAATKYLTKWVCKN